MVKKHLTLLSFREKIFRNITSWLLDNHSLALLALYPHSVANNDSRVCTTYEEGERIPLYEAKEYLKQFHQQKMKLYLNKQVTVMLVFRNMSL
jgi:hypothetical protein